ncbi:hypothetical protein [Paucibacter soli]|uniref:hypothetical protein n=1 Tax=Paucibacter soli TaxID=3133433 RepID=UPI0030A2D378
MLAWNALPTGLDAAGPLGISGDCDLTLLNQQHLHGRLDQFHDGDRAIDLRMARQRGLVSLPLREVQWLRMRAPAEAAAALAAAPVAAVPIRLSGPSAKPVPGLCLRSRAVPGGLWLDLLDAKGEVHRWFVHDVPQVELKRLN